MFLFNRKTVRFFRKDGHDWRKKSDGKTIRETHEKLKVCTLPTNRSQICAIFLRKWRGQLSMAGHAFRLGTRMCSTATMHMQRTPCRCDLLGKAAFMLQSSRLCAAWSFLLWHSHLFDPQRRCYWLLDGDDNVVLVHYLSSIPHANRAMVHSASSGHGLGAVCLNAVQAQPAPPQKVCPAVCLGLGETILYNQTLVTCS